MLDSQKLRAMAKNPGELPGSPSSDIVKLSDQTRATDAHASNADENIVFSKVSSSDREIARGSSGMYTPIPATTASSSRSQDR